MAPRPRQTSVNALMRQRLIRKSLHQRSMPNINRLSAIGAAVAAAMASMRIAERKND
ncbi:hypothetical protein KCP76_13735 [Salmonella enterica subsp. enterica serovar Weltevreden]|nr:hypothetical protein KCP76_13735 [Salmonella enterica subsp. enterica serovar Weltevreden]